MILNRFGDSVFFMTEMTGDIRQRDDISKGERDIPRRLRTKLRHTYGRGEGRHHKMTPDKIRKMKGT